jgi:hypothetical protein
MLNDPIRQRLLKADVAPGFLGFDPFVAEDFLALGLKFPIERRVFQQVRRRCFFGRVRHNRKLTVAGKLNPSDKSRNRNFLRPDFQNFRRWMRFKIFNVRKIRAQQTFDFRPLNCRNAAR